MTLSINIENITKPVFKETSSFFTFDPVLNLAQSFFKKLIDISIKRICNDIDTATLSIEGAFSHVKNIEQHEAEKLLKETVVVINKLSKLEDRFKKTDFFDSKILKSKFTYMLKSIYKFESKLHKAVYKNAPTLKTDEDLKRGVIKMNSLHTQKLLAQ